MTGCPGCGRTGVAQIGGLCGKCGTEIASAVNDAIEDLDVDVADHVYDVGYFEYDDYLHVRLVDEPPQPPTTTLNVVASDDHADILHVAPSPLQCHHAPERPSYRTDLVTAVCATDNHHGFELCSRCEWPDDAQDIVATDCRNGHPWCPGPGADDPDPDAAWGGKCSGCSMADY